MHYLGGDLSAWWKLTRAEQVQLLAWALIRSEPKQKRPRGPSREPTDAELAALRARALKHGAR